MQSLVEHSIEELVDLLNINPESIKYVDNGIVVDSKNYFSKDKLIDLAHEQSADHIG
tara:strand:+ start:1216 stop:1386 length:171 start_codon:yes stop_codon:yes gene_type:complete